MLKLLVCQSESLSAFFRRLPLRGLKSSCKTKQTKQSINLTKIEQPFGKMLRSMRFHTSLDSSLEL